MQPRDVVPNFGRATFDFFMWGDRSGERYYPWHKPIGCKWVYIFGVGGGSGGARVAAGTTAGAGGGTGSVTHVLYPAWVLPDRLFVVPGTGGPGATTAGQNTGGASSRVLVHPDVSAASQVVFVANRHPGVTGQSTGTAAAAATGSQMALSGAALFYAIGGTNGNIGAAAADTNGGGVTPGGNGITFTGGSGGGTGTGAGGLFNAAGSWGWRARTGATGTTGGNGTDGVGVGIDVKQMLARGEPLLFSGGGGGGGSSAGTAGTGGAGGPGCGGGGGGGSSVTSGNGGDGGHGFVVIWTW